MGSERRGRAVHGRVEVNPSGEEPTDRPRQKNAGLWEPYDGRLSRTVLREREGEVPSRHSPGSELLGLRGLLGLHRSPLRSWQPTPYPATLAAVVAARDAGQARGGVSGKGYQPGRDPRRSDLVRTKILE